MYFQAISTVKLTLISCKKICNSSTPFGILKCQTKAKNGYIEKLKKYQNIDQNSTPRTYSQRVHDIKGFCHPQEAIHHNATEF